MTYLRNEHTINYGTTVDLNFIDENHYIFKRCLSNVDIKNKPFDIKIYKDLVINCRNNTNIIKTKTTIKSDIIVYKHIKYDSRIFIVKYNLVDELIKSIIHISKKNKKYF